ncbi:MAG TPA: hypothetical protein VK498_08515 [Ferruginibacter sp.]|nr:hypothetical protein [Ferruginibacter sp.]
MEIDIIGDILKKMSELHPGSAFIQSLYRQYQDRGSLSKKQLEGLESKAAKSGDIPPAKMATLQAIILRKHAKHRSEIPVSQEIDLSHASKELSETNEKINHILAKYPTHKRVLYFKIKTEKEGLTTAEIYELDNFVKLLLKK